MKERRVYYLDCSYSMVTNGLWEKVRDNLKKAIDNVSDETTELFVIPFAFDKQTAPKLSPIFANATESGKSMIMSKIDALPMNKNTMTYHYVPIEDFYNKRVANDRITYMFLMTDGQDEDAHKRAMTQLQKWTSRYGNKNVFGFYVELCDEATNSHIEKVIERQEHLWTVKTADVNINLVRLHNNFVFNIRNEKELMIKPEIGNLSKCNIEVMNTSCEGNCYKISSFRVTNEGIVACIVANKGIANMPETATMTLCLRPVLPSQSNGYTCLVNNKIYIKCINKKERTLKIRFE